jgi:hypothetical protein
MPKIRISVMSIGITRRVDAYILLLLCNFCGVISDQSRHVVHLLRVCPSPLPWNPFTPDYLNGRVVRQGSAQVHVHRICFTPDCRTGSGGISQLGLDIAVTYSREGGSLNREALRTILPFFYFSLSFPLSKLRAE